LTQLVQQVIAVTQQSGSSIIDHVRSAGVEVIAVLIILAIFSVISWAIIFLKWLLLRRAQRENELFVKMFWESRQLDEIHRHSKSLIHAPNADVFAAGYEELRRFQEQGENFTAGGGAATTFSRDQLAAARENIQRALNRSINDQMSRLEKAVPFLATVGNTSPFIGLLGTVVGIIVAFGELSTMSEKGQAALEVVGPGISQALIATAAGLFAAIPAVIFYNHFSAKLRALESQVNSFASEFMNILERHILK